MTEQGPRPAGGALAGIEVVDLSRVLAGPYATQMMGDHGADVLKVEPPSGDGTRDWGDTYEDGTSAYYAGLNRNKRHVSIDLSTPRGRELVIELLKTADVLVENFKPGTMEAWGLGPDVLLERFPRLVYCRITAFGADGPMGGLPGYDAVMQAYTGIMDMNGEQGRGPVRVPVPITDLTTGLLALSGVLLALHERTTSGRGQVVDLTLLDAAVSLLHPSAATYFLDGQPPRRLGTGHPSISPSDTFATRSGYLYVAAGTDRQFVTLCEFLGAPALAADPRFRTNRDRLTHNDALVELLAGLVATMDTSLDTARQMIADGIPASVVRSVDQVVDDPQVHQRQMVQTVGGFRVLGIPVKLSRTPGTIRTPPEPHGTDTVAVLLELGLTADEIATLEREGAVVGPRAVGPPRTPHPSATQ